MAESKNELKIDLTKKKLKKDKIKCKGVDCHNNQCRLNSQEESLFCKNHQYMELYTDEMMNNLKWTAIFFLSFKK
jgi:hypothetical protein